MNNKHQENGALTGPLIFTVPAYGFVMALYVDWLGRSNRPAFLPRPLRKRLNRTRHRLAIEAVAPLCAEVPPGPRWFR